VSKELFEAMDRWFKAPTFGSKELLQPVKSYPTLPVRAQQSYPGTDGISISSVLGLRWFIA
jgi:hypothetical protein